MDNVSYDKRVKSASLIVHIILWCQSINSRWSSTAVTYDRVQG